MKYGFSLALLLLVSLLFGQETTLAITDINYIDVVEGRALKGSILIEDGKIRAVGPDISIPDGVTKLNGSGQWLIPGLVDAHIHLFQSGGLYTRPDAINLTKNRPYEEEIAWLQEQAPDLLKRYLRSGITTVIDVGGPMYNYTIRDLYRDSTLYPNLFLTGPLVSTYQPAAFQIEDPPIVKVNNKEEAIALVQKQLPYQPDFIKIWYIATRELSAESTYEIIEATIAESHRHGLKVAVHATQLNTAKLAIKAGADILVHSVDDPVDDEFIRSLVENEVVYIPTLMVGGQYLKAFAQKLDHTAADFAYANPIPLGSLHDPQHFPEGSVFDRYEARLPTLEARQAREDSIMDANLELISRQSVTIATGTDAGNIGTLHTSSYFSEIDRMKGAGLSNAQILAASTINGAKILDMGDELGSIETGKIADLVVLNRNPLEDIQAIQDVAYVIKAGNLMQPDTILLPTPEDLVQQQLNGYNARNIEAFVAPYSEDVELYNFPDQLIGKGKEQMRVNYSGMFKQIPDLHCELVNRTIMGNTVIDHERVTGFPGGRVLQAIAIYKIVDHKIAKVYFISE
ncbi:amidohydrolase family protein [Flavilitoribacter nigricans]|uniref:Amidohydrolase n=1 Tax=Flavilitoribacter nigricans (strain ATCC 23147 / DSM 23189 / NBRC 102662 / NCIMB 1420 / SS-2) TaxID=1122177 RepID=A0A2D0NCP1_FLAN2|nr:amidohydrolase family protein [Flavilitoribacter nigricans]PHN06247.1 amidohydrolase [Flavilitoribacter nigricans DSM 23189 = NBRC 102662]